MRNISISCAVALAFCLAISCSQKIKSNNPSISKLHSGFLAPPDSAKPGVYWYFMDGNMSAETMTKDLESMKQAGIANLIFLEVNVGVARGPVEFFSEKWQELFVHAVHEAERLGIEVTLGIGPGWTGSGGPWVKIEQSMQILVSSSTDVKDGQSNIKLPLPPQKAPYFGEGAFTAELKKEWNDFYEDVAVLAYPTPGIKRQIADADEKALYYRAPYSSAPGVKQYLPSLSSYDHLPAEALIDKKKIIDLTEKLSADGTLDWVVPKGNWTVMRFGRRNNSAITRPAPMPGLGFEADKFDTVAINAHLEHYVGTLIKKIGKPKPGATGGLKRLHMDSWEMGSQNWTPKFREEFINRRGYDPLPFYPVYAGNVVESLETSERFLWDLRQTSQELIIDYHAKQVKRFGAKHGLGLSIEPYDMNPTADLELGAVGDVPMAEFWSKDLGFNSTFSAMEATSIGHVDGKSLIPAEAFTAQNNEGWKQYPGSMKDQGDWAFASGINRFVYHTFQSQSLPDSLRPGMTMGPYGVHWDRNQTWWPMVGTYHDYISRCQYILQQGNTVADVLYLNPEGSPHVFRPPFSALEGDVFLPDRKGYNFDACSPSQLYKASVKDGKIVFQGGASYHILVLPAVKTMTPALLEQINSLVKAGATVVGAPPVKAPGLTDRSNADEKIAAIVKELWDTKKIIFNTEIANSNDNLYPAYELTANILKSKGILPDFTANGAIRYTHRAMPGIDIYFVANRTDRQITTEGVFRSTQGNPQLWNPITGEIRGLSEFKVDGQQTTIRLSFDVHESYFIIFDKNKKVKPTNNPNFPIITTAKVLDKAWTVKFDNKWGGPEQIVFDKLVDWTQHPIEGIKYYSGTAVYKQTFDFADAGKNGKSFLSLGEVYNMARVKLNGKDLGVLWTAPWQLDITNVVKQKDNLLEIEIVNLWPNRLIGDEKLPKEKRLTYTTHRHYTKDSPLLKSGLVGPVTILKSK
ncbi:MAG: glycosyl hydrolase [Pedobacter sp.]|nr:MAG: glycosyl hydrolase [Pedobacter sp.]